MKIKSRHSILRSRWEEESHISWPHKAEGCKSNKAILIGAILGLHDGKENGNYYIIVGYILGYNFYLLIKLNGLS